MSAAPALDLVALKGIAYQRIGGVSDELYGTIVRLLDDAVDVPERYRLVAVLMAFDMGSWQEKDLGEIARKMNNIERRLELARGGPHTQKIQKDVVARLDEIGLWS